MSVDADRQRRSLSLRGLGDLWEKLNLVMEKSKKVAKNIDENTTKFFGLYKDIKLNFDQLETDSNLISDLQRFIGDRTPKNQRRSRKHEEEIEKMLKYYSEDLGGVMAARKKWEEEFEAWEQSPNQGSGSPKKFNKLMADFPVYKRAIVSKEVLRNKKESAIREAEQFPERFKELKQEIVDLGGGNGIVKHYNETTFKKIIEMAGNPKLMVNSIGELKNDDFGKSYFEERNTILGIFEQLEGELEKLKNTRIQAESARTMEAKIVAETAGLQPEAHVLQSRAGGSAPLPTAASEVLQTRVQGQPASGPLNESSPRQTIAPVQQAPASTVIQETADSGASTDSTASLPSVTASSGTSNSTLQDRFQNVDRSSSAQQQTGASSQNAGAFITFEQKKEQEKLKGLYKTLGNISFQGDLKVDETNYKSIRNETSNTINALIKENPEIYKGIKHEISPFGNSDTIRIGDVEIRRAFKKDENTQKGSVDISMSIPLTDSALLLMIKTNNGVLPLVMAPCNDPSLALKVFQASLLSNAAVKLDKADTELLRNSEFSSMIPPDNKLEEYAKTFKEFYDMKISEGMPYAFGGPLPNDILPKPSLDNPSTSLKV